jgi:adenosylcobinamide-GDP ribazoletransferase
MMAVTTLTQPYVGGGLASAFLPRAVDRVPLAVAIGLFGLAASVALCAWWRVIGGVTAIAALFVGAAAVVAFARRRIGGFTGDVLGAAGVVAETIGLVVAAAKW